jgi:hypothetical protein
VVETSKIRARVSEELGRPVSVSGTVSSGLAIICATIAPLEGNVRAGWLELVAHLAGGVLPIAFLWCLGAGLIQRSRNRLVPFGGALGAFILAPLQVVYGLMFLPMILFSGR